MLRMNLFESIVSSEEECCLLNRFHSIIFYIITAMLDLNTLKNVLSFLVRFSGSSCYEKFLRTGFKPSELKGISHLRRPECTYKDKIVYMQQLYNLRR